jgi:aspartate/glutamate/glutamine transport system substrate-binding protein
MVADNQQAATKMMSVGVSRKRTSMLRKAVSSALLIAAALAVVNGASSRLALAGTLEDIKARGKLIACVFGDYKPFGYYDAGGKHVGLDLDIARMLAKALLGDENKVELVPVTSAERIPSLQGKKVDIVIAAMTITDERKQLVDFSEPYFLSGSLVLTSKSSSIRNLADLRGKTVGLLHGTVQVGDMAELAPTSERVGFDTSDEAVAALKSGQTDAYTDDDIFVITLVHDDAELKSVGDPFRPRPFGVAVRKGEMELLNWVNEQMSTLRNDGSFDLLWKKYFGEVDAKLMRLKSAPTAKPAKPELIRTQPPQPVKQPKQAPKQ